LIKLGQLSDTTNYKEYVQKFETGSPQEWIESLKEFEEIWTQNATVGGTGTTASKTMVLVRGGIALAFESALQDNRTTE
jgi:hypothetical protein